MSRKWNRLQDLLYPDAGLPIRPAPGIPSEGQRARDMRVTPAMGQLLAHLVADGRRNVLELGAGSSSVAFATALKPSGRLTSLEQNPNWCADAWAEVKATGIDAELIPVAPRLTAWPFPCYRYEAALAARGPYDLVLVDAPQWYYGRDGALPLIYRHLAENALIVVDDAGRHPEQWAIKRWLATYRGLEVETFDPAFGRNGVAVLRAKALVERANLRSWVSGLLHVGERGLVRARRGKL